MYEILATTIPGHDITSEPTIRLAWFYRDRYDAMIANLYAMRQSDPTRTYRVRVIDPDNEPGWGAR